MTGEQVAAWVDGEPVPAAEVAAEVVRLRTGPPAFRLPPDGTAGGRQLRRWVAQRVVLRRLLEREAGTRRLDVRPGPAPADTTLPADIVGGHDHGFRQSRPDEHLRPDAAVLGSAAADVLATSAAARAVFASVTADVTVTEQEVRAHYTAHPDRYLRPVRWLVRQALRPGAPGPPTAELAAAIARARPVELDPATLLPELRAALSGAVATAPAADVPTGPDRPAVAGPVRSRHGWVLLAVDAVLPAGPVPYADVRAAIGSRLLDRARQAAFGRWLDAEAAARIRLGAGFEHPADPRQPDATHRH